MCKYNYVKFILLLQLLKYFYLIDMIEKENEFENNIINRPCTSETECAIGCIKQRQFDGVCIRNVCQCKTARIEEKWYEYRKIVTERKTCQYK